jgi:hypothetical protein
MPLKVTLLGEGQNLEQALDCDRLPHARLFYRARNAVPIVTRSLPVGATGWRPWIGCISCEVDVKHHPPTPKSKAIVTLMDCGSEAPQGRPLRLAIVTPPGLAQSWTHDESGRNFDGCFSCAYWVGLTPEVSRRSEV